MAKIYSTGRCWSYRIARFQSRRQIARRRRRRNTTQQEQLVASDRGCGQRQRYSRLSSEDDQLWGLSWNGDGKVLAVADDDRTLRFYFLDQPQKDEERVSVGA